jgi:hypothetical protein
MARVLSFAGVMPAMESMTTPMRMVLGKARAPLAARV